MLTQNGIVFDVGVHFALIVVLTMKAPSPTTLIRDGVVFPPPAPGEVRYPAENKRADIETDLTAALELPNRDDTQEPRGYKFGEMTEEQAGAPCMVSASSFDCGLLRRSPAATAERHIGTKALSARTDSSNSATSRPSTPV
jgi:hypothetical protein